MALTDIPPTIRTPGAFSSVDNSQAVSGPQNVLHKRLMIGGKLSTGTAAANTLTLVTRDAQAKTLFGAGSILHRMVVAALRQNQSVELWCLPLADAGGAVKAVGSFTFSGAPTVAGTFRLYCGGQLISVPVAAAAAPATIAGLVVTAASAITDLPCTVAVDGVNTAKVNFTAKHGGLTGNSIDLQYNYYQDEELPAGSGVTIVQPTGGAGNPDVTAAVAAMGDVWLTDWANAYTDSANLQVLEAELASRYQYGRKLEAQMYSVVKGTLSALGTLGAARNSPHHVYLQGSNEPMPPWEKAAESCAMAAYWSGIDPARPLQNLPYVHCLPPKISAQFTQPERDILLHTGIATTKAVSGQMYADRFITTYQYNSAGGPDTSYLDVETLYTLMAIRHSWDDRILRKFPRHKLADDNNDFGPGEPVMTPKVMAAEQLAAAQEWIEVGWVENLDAFKANQIAQRNSSDPNRMDNLLPPDLVNQLRVTATKIQFRLNY
jgi:phage tail sheath gpL-like